MRFGMQMYGLNPIFLEARGEFCRRAAGAGLRFFEPCVAPGPVSGDMASRVWTVDELKENLPLLAEAGISVVSCHAFVKAPETELPMLARELTPLGIRHLVLPAPAFRDEESFADAAGCFNRVARALGAFGTELLLHNGKESGTAYEKMLTMTEPAVKAQPDLGWLLYAGLDPEAFLWRWEDRIASVHYKDMTGDREETVLGRGILDTDPCFQFARAHEVIQYIDQDRAFGSDALGEIEEAMATLNRSKWSHGRCLAHLSVLDTETGELTRLMTFEGSAEAPNWHQQDPDKLYFNRNGSLWRYSFREGTAQELTFSCQNINNDHVLSPDGTQVAVSAEEPSQIYIAPVNGGVARQITSIGPSYLHGWSVKDELAYCAFRTADGGPVPPHTKDRAVDIFRISVNGGAEQKLTDSVGYADGSEYSPDGEYIWYCTTRSGFMQVFRMKRDGSQVTQMTFTPENNWFGHISPDGTKVAYLTFSAQGVDPAEHLPNLPVKLSVMGSDGSDPHTVLTFFGGQGSINVNSWSPDNRHLALVVYELLHK